MRWESVGESHHGSRHSRHVWSERQPRWLRNEKEWLSMCDYSLQSVHSRPAKIGDKLVTRNFGTGTRGFASVTDANTAVCVLPGTELAFAEEISHEDWTIRSLTKWRLASRVKTQHNTAIFRQINKGL